MQPSVIGTQFLVIGNLSLILILMAGHAGIFRIIDDGSKIAKKTNQSEYAIYSNPGMLRNIIPFAERTSQDNQEISDMGKNVIIMQNMFYGIQKQSLVALDIKIGRITSSRSQLLETKEENQIGAFFREIKMKLYDHYTRSSPRGWRAIPVDDKNRARIGRNSEAYLQEQFGKINVNKSAVLRNIITQLNLIRYTVEQSQKTFIASSVLIAIDLQHPENVRVKLIDLAHPIDANDRLFKKYKENFDEGITSLINFLELIRLKEDKTFIRVKAQNDE
jgi:hypothetical protein